MGIVKLATDLFHAKCNKILPDQKIYG